MEADIITIGDEILIGQIVDTNSAWIAKQLNDEGITVREITSISDRPEHIISTLDESGKKASIVLVTGGLGPTKDDRTKSAICTFFNTHLVQDDQVLRHIKGLLSPRGVVINALNIEQALVPESATVLENKLGTAPGLWFDFNNVTYVFMPGVPFEMKYLIENEVIPRIQKMYNTSTIVHRTILTQGLPESMLAERIAAWEDSLPDFIRLAYLPSPQNVKLRLSGFGLERTEVLQRIDLKIKELVEVIPDYIYGYEDETMAGNIGKILKERGHSLATAESCTGGTIAQFITANPGCSTYFAGGIVAYSNDLKINVLGINPELLDRHGAVSKEIVEAMASSARKLFKTDYAISTSGIAGPDGGSEQKPVGTVWIAVSYPDGVISKMYNFGASRERTIVRASQTALNMLRLKLLNSKILK